MPTADTFISYGPSRLHYRIAGSGPVPLLLFHGFGQDRTAFQSWAESLGTTHTLYLFDLYFHGQSEWLSKGPLTQDAWTKILQEFQRQENLSSFEVGGFSLGGKFALATFEAFPDRTRRLILLAPDGIKTSIWYTLATYSVTLRFLFRTLVKNPKWFYFVSSFLDRLGLVSNRVRRFAESQMDTEEKRQRVYNSWVSFRRLKFKGHRIAELLNRFSIPLLMVVAKYDKVTPPRTMEEFLKLVDSKTLEVLDVGHTDMIRNTRI